MTKQESLKKRVRARMAKTGERYAAARKAVLDQSAKRTGGRTWVAEPVTSDETVRAATGRGWNEWCDAIDAWPVHGHGHTAIAAHLVEDLGVDGWWAQTVTVGYERITGLRLPYQRPDGTFTASKSGTIEVDAAELRALLLDDGARADLFPGLDTELRSKPATKALRFAVGPGVALISVADAGAGRSKVEIAHEKLPNFDDVDEWKFYWSEWLAALEAG